MRSRHWIAVIAAVAAFAAGCSIMLWMLKEPLGPVEYFLSGAVGTFAALIAIFISLIDVRTWRSLFYKQRRPKPGDSPRPGRSGTLGI